MAKRKTQGYYRLDNIIKRDADYNVVFGERSNGKTYAVLEYMLEQFVASGYRSQGAIIRRWREDIVSKRATSFFSGLVSNGRVTEITGGDYSEVVCVNGRFYLGNYSQKLNKVVTADKPFAYAFALSDMEHDKSVSYPDVRTVLFDEFLTRRYYLPDEFMLFMNVLSTIIRRRDDVKIFMMGNTVNKYCPYFQEMGLKHVAEMEQGTIDVYRYGDSGLTVAVEYAASTAHEKESNKYFAFDNANLQMLTGGKWELALYPHLPVKFDRADIVFTYFIEFQGAVVQCEVVSRGRELFTYVHEKTTPIQNPDRDVIFSLDHDARGNHRRRILSNGDKLGQRIAWFYAHEKIFFQNNEVGEIVRNYIQESERSMFARV